LMGPERPSLDMGYAIGVLEVELRLPLCHSLKEKRGILAKTKTHLRKRHAVSLAEVAHRDAWGRAGLAIATVSGDAGTAEQHLRSTLETLNNDREVQVVDYSIQVL